MTDARARMVHDMGRKMSEDVEAVMQRNVDVAQHVFESLEVTEMVMRVAASVCGAAIMTAIQTRKPETDPGELYDIVAAAIAKEVLARKRHLHEIMAMLETMRAARR